MRYYKHEFLTGVISPISWNQEKKINGYSIFTKYEEDVLLKGKSIEKNFMKFKNKQVKVFGYFLASTNNARVFEVTKTSLKKK